MIAAVVEPHPKVSRLAVFTSVISVQDDPSHCSTSDFKEGQGVVAPDM